MFTFAGYHITERLYESSNSLVYRAVRTADQQPVILKILKETCPSPELLAWFKREYNITHTLNLSGIPRVYALELIQQRQVIVLEDSGCTSLMQLELAGTLALHEFLDLAIAIAEILGQVHQHRIIHKDINPANIVRNPTTDALQLIDFGIAAVFSRENPTFRNPNVLEGTLAYMSPEQTGRMNRAMDYRTDFYSLGVTFYELLTGDLPFVSDDALELVHSHIARQPVAPHERKPDIPAALSAIVLKLMAKNAEDRYQSAYGLKADLEIVQSRCCAAGLSERAHLVNDFTPGQYDISDRFLIPQKLYGREAEHASLLAAFERVSLGTSEMLLVCGYSGIGKSSLVQEIYRPVTEKRGYFIAGKFDQFQRNNPYLAITQAFRSLMRQLLTESEDAIAGWRESLRDAVGPNGQVLIEVIPELELIIGPQPAVQQLGPTEAQNRFNLVFRSFIHIFCQPEHPLCIFLDDLQWADAATLHLIELMMTDPQTSHLFLIGAYRDNEVNPTHPLMLTLEKLHAEQCTLSSITLAPLQHEHVTDLIAETLHTVPQRVLPLAECVVQKTGGNPFFVNQFLKMLYQEALLSFNMEQRRWEWEIERIAHLDMTDNVVDLTIGKLNKLPAATRQVLRLAACVGNSFDLPTLAIISEQTLAALAHDLLPAIEEELVLAMSELEIPDDDEADTTLYVLHYKFLHDRVQQAAYALIDEEEKQRIHLQIGRLLLARLSKAERAEKLFDLVNHLNLGRALLTCPHESLDLVHFNLEAGQKARDATAYRSALVYLTVGIEMAGEQIWEQHHNLALALYQGLAEVAYLTGDFEQSHALITTILAHVTQPIEQAEVYNLLLVQYTMLAKYAEAIEVGRTALRLLSIDLPDQDILTALNAELAEAEGNLGQRAIAALLDEAEMTIPEKRVAVKLLTNIDPPAYFTNPDLYALVVVKMANLSLTYGHVAQSAKAYGTYGIILGPRLEQYQRGYEFTLLSVRLSERFHDMDQKCKACHNLVDHVGHWVRPLREIYHFREEGFKAGLESGELQHAGYILMYQVFALFYQGDHLEERVLDDIQKGLFFTRQTRNQWATDGIVACHLATCNLLGQTADWSDFCTDTISEAAYLEHCYAVNGFSSICIYLTFKVQVLYLAGAYREALHCATEAAGLLHFILGVISVAENNFYYSLCLARCYIDATPNEQQQFWRQLQANQQQMRIWADNCPRNFQHMYLLVAAEMARLDGNVTEAMDLYDQAIETASDNQFIQDEALASELAALFWLERGKPAFAQLLMRRAYAGYRRWGATRKAEMLQQEYPALLTEVDEHHQKRNGTRITTSAMSRGTNVPTTSTGSEALDLSSIVKATQAISDDIVLNSLLSKLMRILIENAGAQRGFLILEHERQWVIEARGVIDAMCPVEQNAETHDNSNHNTGTHSSVLDAPVAIDQQHMLLPTSMINYVVRTQEPVVLSDAAEEGQFTRDAYIQAYQPKSVLCMPMIHQGKLSGVLYLENNLTTGAFTDDRLDMLHILSTQAAISIENARFYEHQVTLTRAYSRFVPPEILQFLGKESIMQVRLGDQIQEEMTVLFSDIRDFTALSEQMTPQENFNFINSYLSRVSPVIRKHHGFIDKYIGDAIMALFPGPPDDAVQAAVEMQREVDCYNALRIQQGYTPISIGVGLHTGSVMLGTVGEAERMEGTVISDVVNLASRLEGLTKLYGSPILVTERTLFQLNHPDQYQFRFLDHVKVKGKQDAVSMFEILDGNVPEVMNMKLETGNLFDQGLMYYHHRDFHEAQHAFQQVLASNPHDKAAQLYLQRLTYFVEHGVPVDWDGVGALTEK